MKNVVAAGASLGLGLGWNGLISMPSVIAVIVAVFLFCEELRQRLFWIFVPDVDSRQPVFKQQLHTRSSNHDTAHVRHGIIRHSARKHMLHWWSGSSSSADRSTSPTTCAITNVDAIIKEDSTRLPLPPTAGGWEGTHTGIKVLKVQPKNNNDEAGSERRPVNAVHCSSLQESYTRHNVTSVAWNDLGSIEEDDVYSAPRARWQPGTLTPVAMSSHDFTGSDNLYEELALPTIDELNVEQDHEEFISELATIHELDEQDEECWDLSYRLIIERDFQYSILLLKSMPQSDLASLGWDTLEEVDVHAATWCVF